MPMPVTSARFTYPQTAHKKDPSLNLVLVYSFVCYLRDNAFEKESAGKFLKGGKSFCGSIY